MSNVVVSNRIIFNQRISNIKQNEVLLPFNITKEQVQKLIGLLSKTKVTFFSEPDKLNIETLEYNNTKIKPINMQLNNCRFTLSKAYVVTMKQTFINKVKGFYNKVVGVKAPERPVFNIGNETNLQQALAEATTEIDLSAINASLNSTPVIETPTTAQPSQQVLANNPMGETVIANPVNLTPVEQPATIVMQTQVAQAPVVQENIQTVNQPVVDVNTQQMVEQPKVKVKKLKGSTLAIPIVVVWLGAVFYGTLKLVTSILT